MTWETLPKRRQHRAAEPLLRIYDERHGYLNATAMAALRNGHERVTRVLFQKDDLGRVSVCVAPNDDPEAYAVTHKGVVNPIRVVEMLTTVKLPVTFDLEASEPGRLLFVGRSE